ARPPDLMCFTIQREVGERLLARSGTREYGPASVVCQLFANVESLAKLPATAFWPKPKIESVMLRMTPNWNDLPSEAARRHIANVVRAAFVHRRKMMRHIASEWRAEGALADAGIDPAARPERIPPDAWQRLAEALPDPLP